MLEDGSFPARDSSAGARRDHRRPRSDCLPASRLALRAEGCDVDAPSLGEALPGVAARQVATGRAARSRSRRVTDAVRTCFQCCWRRAVGYWSCRASPTRPSSVAVSRGSLWMAAKRASLDQLLATVLALAAGREVLSESERTGCSSLAGTTRRPSSRFSRPFFP